MEIGNLVEIFATYASDSDNFNITKSLCSLYGDPLPEFPYAKEITAFITFDGNSLMPSKPILKLQKNTFKQKEKIP